MNPVVVCVKVKDIRPKYNNLKEWMNDPENLYIGRKGVVFIDGVRFPAKNSPFANPYKLKSEDQRESVLQSYRLHLHKLIDNGEVDLSLLDNKLRLGCWCASPVRALGEAQCHGDILLEEHIRWKNIDK